MRMRKVREGPTLPSTWTPRMRELVQLDRGEKEEEEEQEEEEGEL